MGERQASVAPAPLDECIIANALTDWRFTLEQSASVYVYGGEHCAVSAPFSAPSTSTKLGLLAQNLCSAEAVVSKLTAVCVPLLRKSAAGRVVNVSSAAGQFSFLASDRLKMDPEKLYYAYPVSKTALNAATVLLANALKRDGIRVNASCPGMVATRVSRMQGKSPGRRRRLHRLDSENDRKWAYGRLLQSNRPHRLVTSMPERKTCKIIRERAWSAWSRMMCAKWRTAMAQESSPICALKTQTPLVAKIGREFRFR